MSWRPMKASFSMILLPPTTRLQHKVATLGALGVANQALQRRGIGVDNGRDRDAPVRRRKPSPRPSRRRRNAPQSGLVDRGVFGSIVLEFAHGNLYPTRFSGRHPRAEGPDARFEWPCWRRFERLVARRPVSRVEWWMVAPPSRQPRATGSPPKEGEVSVTAALSVPVGSRKTPERRSPAESGPQEPASTGLHEGCRRAWIH